MVLLHGYGTDGHDLIGLGATWRELFPHMLFVAPNAPTACAINPAGYEWFPLAEVDRDPWRQAGVAQARPIVLGLLDALWRQTGLGAADTVLAGFSQGAMLAVSVGTALPEPPLAAVLGFSGALMPAEGLAAGRFARPPVALIHGALDEVVDPDLSRQADARLRAAGYPVELHLSPGTAHTIAPDGIAFATGFLQRHVRP
jgi:phospholipase/carboxylesterase